MAGSGGGSGGGVPPVSTHTQQTSNTHVQGGLLDAQINNLSEAEAHRQFILRTRELKRYTRDIQNAQAELLKQFDAEQDEEVKKIYADRMRSLQSQLENEMQMYQTQYSFLSTKLSEHDKQFHQDMYLHRKDDLRALEREIRYRMEDVEESVDGAHDAFGELTNMLNTFNLNHLTDELTNTAQSFIDLKREMSKQLNWSADEWRQYSEDISQIVTDLHNKISRGEVAEVGSYVTMELGIKEEDLVVAYTEALSRFKTANGTDAQSIDNLVKYVRQHGDDYEYINTIGDSIKAIANTDLETTNADMVEALNSMITTLDSFTGGKNPELVKSMMQQYTAVQASMDNQFMGDAIKGLLTQLLNPNEQDLAEIVDLYGGQGGAYQIRETLKTGDVYGAVDQLITNIQKYLRENTGGVDVNESEALGKMGLDADAIIALANFDQETYQQDMQTAISALEASAGSQDQFIENMQIGFVKEMTNAFSNSTIGRALVDLLDTLDVDFTDLTIVMMGIHQLFGGFLGRIGRGLWNSATGGGVGLLNLGGSAGATGSGWLANLVGNTGTVVNGALTGNTGMLGGLARFGSNLPGRMIIPQAMQTGTGLATYGALGAGSILSVGAASVDAIGDLINSANDSATWKERETSMKGAIAKGGSIAAGAIIGSVIPGVGTLIGAGIGGLVALLGGDRIAEAWQDWADGTDRIERGLENSKAAQDRCIQSMQKATQLQDKLTEFNAEYATLKSMIQSGLGTDTPEFQAQLDKVRNLSTGVAEFLPEADQIQNQLNKLVTDGDLSAQSLAKVDEQFQNLSKNAEETVKQLQAQSEQERKLSNASALQGASAANDQWVKSTNDLNAAKEKVAKFEEFGRMVDSMQNKNPALGIQRITNPDGSFSHYGVDWDALNAMSFTTDATGNKVANNEAILIAQQLQEAYVNKLGMTPDVSVSMTDDPGAYIGQLLESWNRVTQGDEYKNLQSELTTKQTSFDDQQKQQNDLYDQAVAMYKNDPGIQNWTDTALAGKSFKELAALYKDMSDKDRDIFEAMLNGYQRANDELKYAGNKIALKAYQEEVNKIKSQKGETDLVNVGSYAQGLSEVPNDGLAMVHKGEAVLTAEQALTARADGGIPMTNFDPNDMASSDSFLVNESMNSQISNARWTERIHNLLYERIPEKLATFMPDWYNKVIAWFEQTEDANKTLLETFKRTGIFGTLLQSNVTGGTLLQALFSGMTGQSMLGGTPLASGLDTVPTNDYPATLHAGEAVLNAQAASAWRAGVSSGGYGGGVSGLGNAVDGSGISGGSGGSVGELRICTDGAPSAMGSGSWQPETAISIGGRPLDASQINYIVYPGAPNAIPGDYARALGVVIDRGTNKAVWGIVGENGPAGNGWGEVSIHLAHELGYTSADGSAGPSGNFEVKVFPGVKPSWSYESINQQAAQAGASMGGQGAGAGGASLPTYAVGTPFVPNDQVALVHKGEMIVPADQNPLNQAMNSSTGQQVSGADTDKIVSIIQWAVGRIESKLDSVGTNNTTQVQQDYYANRTTNSAYRPTNTDVAFSF